MASNNIAGHSGGTITEKTVELNLTLESINRLYSLTRRPGFAWGPTLKQEANFGFDVGLSSAGRFIYVQYKRAYNEAGGHFFKLNRTKYQDQHKKLLDLESAGICVRYALPRFTTLGFIAHNRRRLLLPPRTAWLRPSQIPMPNGGVGQHDIHVHLTRRWLTSEPVELEDNSDDFPFKEDNLESLTKYHPDDADYLHRIFSKIFADDNSALRGAAIIFTRLPQ